MWRLLGKGGDIFQLWKQDLRPLVPRPWFDVTMGQSSPETQGRWLTSGRMRVQSTKRG